MMKKRVLIVYTGGTFGMVPSDQGYVPMTGLADRLVARLQVFGLDDLPEFEVLEFGKLIDSSNLTPADWTRIGNCLRDHWAQYDGFVILHGTDTMAYTASALSFMLQPLDKPVIITGSQIPLAELRNDADINLITSLQLAARDDIHEVCICFGNRILRGNRAVKVNSMDLAAFDSPNMAWLGSVGIDINMRDDLLLEAGVPDIQVPEYDPDAVLVFTLYPGVNHQLLQSMLDINPRARALIIRSYGVGNPPDANQELMQLLEQACARGLVVVNLTQCQQGPVVQGAYATGATLNRIGVVGGSDLTLEATFAKLHWLLATRSDPQEVRQLMATPLRGECRC